MAGRPVTNAAFDIGIKVMERGREVAVHEWPDQMRAMFAADFTFHDRRKLIGLPDRDRSGFIDMTVENAGADGRAEYFSELLAVRGDRLALTRLSISYEDGVVREFAQVVQVDEECSQVERLVRTDLDNVDDAIAELDRLHTEIGD